MRGANADRAQWLATGVRPTRVDQFEGRSVVTNAAGEFRIGGLSAGSYELSVRLSGHADPVRQTVSVQDGEMTAAVEVVVPKGLTIAGRLMLADGGAPTGDIELTATGGDREYAADVAADGSFHFDGVADGAYVISMMLPPAGWSLPPRHDVPAGATDVRLVLERCAVVIGSVVDADGEPVKARVWAEPDAVDLRAVVAHDTDAEGRFRIEVPQGFRGTVNAFDERKRTGEQANVVAGQEGVRITLQGH